MKYYKVIFVDFDNTICLHTKRIRGHVEKYEFKPAKEVWREAYKFTRVNTLLFEYLREQKENGAIIILLSLTTAQILPLKKEWCNYYCNGLFSEFFSSSSTMGKADVIECYCTNYHINLSSVLLIDDASNERWGATDNKINSTSPQLIQEEMFQSYIQEDDLK